MILDSQWCQDWWNISKNANSKRKFDNRRSLTCDKSVNETNVRYSDTF
jgi:hypothetical protein